MTGEPYTAQERADAWHENLSFSGHWEIGHEPDPSFFIPATNRTPLRREDVTVSFR